MNANELRAAERLRKIANLGAEQAMAVYANSPYAAVLSLDALIAIDRATLADAYLAEHDPTPLTADFIRQHTTLQYDGVREFEMELAVRIEEPIRE
jgi:hypothetical protein